MLTGCPHRRAPAAMMPAPPLGRRRRDQPAEVARRTRIPGRPRCGQQPLRRDPGLRRHDPLAHQLGHRGVVALSCGPRRTFTAGVVAHHLAANSLRCGAADRSGATVGTYLPVGRQNVHSFPRRLQWSSLGGAGDWLAPPPSPPRAQAPGRHEERGVGTSTWPPAGTSIWLSAGTFPWPWTTRRNHPRARNGIR